MYENKYVVAIKSDGKILREFGESVILPLGKEYSILLKNLTNVRSAATVHIDGVEATAGNLLVIEPNGTIELGRYMTANDSGSGAAFKFIERTTQIENSGRGVRLDDGLIRVEFWRELAPARMPDIDQQLMDQFNKQTQRRITINGPVWATPQYPAWPYNITCQTANLSQTNIVGHQSGCMSANDLVGITVPGQHIHQPFATTSFVKSTEQSTVLILKLKAQYNDQPVKEPITVKYRPTCQTCSKINTVSSKFCAECGTSLRI